MTWHLPLAPGKQPFTVQLEARRLQEEAAGRGQRGWAHFLEQGLGKTAVEMDSIFHLWWQGEIAGAVVVAPPSVVLNWPDEAIETRFQGVVHTWPNFPKFGDLPTDRPWILVINFEAVITARGEKFFDEILKYFGRKVKITVDEGSKIKNPTAKRTKALLMYGASVNWTGDLSGTPAPQGPHDYWSQLKFLKATNLRYFPWRNRYCQMGGYMGKQVIGVADVDGLQAQLDSCAIFAKKKDWTDLPEKLWAKPRRVEMTSKQRKLYEAIQNDFYAVVAGQEVSAAMAITQMVKLSQITSGFIKSEEGKVIPLFEKPEEIPKMRALMEVWEETPKKVITFAASKYSVEALRQVSERLGRKPAVIRGGMEPEERRAERIRFNEDPECRDIICQIVSGGIGLTLLGKPGKDRCSVTCFYENTFSLEERLQAEDRNHRHGQDEMVTYYDFVSAPIDLAATLALQTKSALDKVITDPLVWRPAA